MRKSAAFFGSKEEEKNKKDSPIDLVGTEGNLEIPEGAIVTRLQNPTDTSRKPISHIPVTEKVFATPPMLTDIRQSSLTGNCSLLAALQALIILPNGPEIIKSMIKDEGENVIISIRMFNENAEPQYFSIEKSLPKNADFLSEGALWVKLIEKAYSAYKGGSYADLTGGFTDKQIRLLTGAKYGPNPSTLPYQAKKRLSDLKDFSHKEDFIYIFHELMRVSNGTPSEIQERILNQVFKGEKESFNSWKDWLEENNKREVWRGIIINNHPICLTHVEQFFEMYKKTMPTFLSNQVYQWLKDEKVLSGPYLSGQYSYEEEKLFKRLGENLANSQPVLLETVKDNPPKHMVSQHAYAVIGVETSPASPYKYVIVRHPAPEDRNIVSHYFYSGGRESKEIYNEHKKKWEIKIESTKSSTARMELSDFCRSFHMLITSEPASVEAINQRVNDYFTKPSLRIRAKTTPH